jgi:hypothetical protein
MMRKRVVSSFSFTESGKEKADGECNCSWEHDQKGGLDDV